MAINPLQAPVNYMAMTPQVDLGKSFSELGQVLAQRQQQQQAQEVKQQFSNDLQAAQTDGSQKAWLGMIAKYPQFREAFGDVRKGVGEERLKNEFTQGFEISNAMEAKDFPAAIDRTKLLIEAKKNSGEPTKIYEDVLGALERGDFAAAQSGANLSLAVLDPDRYEKSVKARTTAAKAPSEVTQAVAAADKAVADAKTAQATATNAAERAKADADKATADANAAKVKAKYAEQVEIAGLTEKNWNVKNLRSQISDRSARLNLDTQKTVAEVADKMSQIKDRLTTLPESAQKLVNESAVNAATAKQAASQYTELAKQLDGLGNSWGAFNTLGEWSRSQFGKQNFRTAIQNEYTRLANSAGIKAYKAAGATGGFSDADLNTALQGIPKDNANPQIMAQFMRGMAKEQAIAAALDNAKTDWLSQNKGQLGRAGGTFIAGDYSVKPGETYADFTTRVTKDVVKRFTTPAQSSLVSQIPTDANPRPMAATTDLDAQAEAIIRGGR